MKQHDARGGDRKTDQVIGADNLKSRRQVAADAGMSDRQYRTAMDVGYIPDEEFNAAVEIDGRVFIDICVF